MNRPRLVSLRNRWFTLSVGATLLVLVFSVLVGFIWLPSVQDDAMFKGLWNAICSAAGEPRRWLSTQPVASNAVLSRVTLSPTTLTRPSGASIGRGATLALRCTMCHGARGMSAADTPNLSGQPASALYKQLLDFQSGARVNAVMAPMVRGLEDQDLRDLASYYAYLPREATAQVDGTPIPGVVATGSPMRNIAPCGSCHGSGALKLGAPRLEGQPINYLRTQLLSFAAGTRRNDTSEQMRNVARQMTPTEIDAAAHYYSMQ